jgi:hypothetical protein
VAWKSVRQKEAHREALIKTLLDFRTLAILLMGQVVDQSHVADISLNHDEFRVNHLFVIVINGGVKRPVVVFLSAQFKTEISRHVSLLLSGQAKCVTALAIVSDLSDNTSMAKKPRKPKTPDPAAFAFGIMQHVIEATGDTPEPQPAPTKGKDPAAVALGRKGGLKGGPARAKKMTAKQRSASAKKAARARWTRKKINADSRRD